MPAITLEPESLTGVSEPRRSMGRKATRGREKRGTSPGSLLRLFRLATRERA